MHTATEHDDSTDSLLLEGLLQLAVEGRTNAREFQRIGEEVHNRLLAAYAEDASTP